MTIKKTDGINEIDGDVKISVDFTATDWRNFKETLKIGGGQDNWKQAYEDFFKARIETRYFEPIRLLKEHGNKKGEGFAITALHCTLIEFLASTLSGERFKFINPNSDAEPGEHEYKGSAGLFKRFLRDQTPFKDYFKTNQIRDDFYENVRCPLLHEARTKGEWKIRAGCPSDPPIDMKEKIVYRNSLHKTFEDFVAWYGKELPLPHNKKLQEAFFRKMEFLCTE